jgi:hypothetical protein
MYRLYSSISISITGTVPVLVFKRVHSTALLVIVAGTTVDSQISNDSLVGALGSGATRSLALSPCRLSSLDLGSLLEATVICPKSYLQTDVTDIQQNISFSFTRP